MMVIDRLYRCMDKGPLRALSLIMALLLAGCVFWEPARFAARTSSLAVWQGIVLIWAVCTGVVHGVGFRPQRMRWLAFFSPLPAFVILAAGLYYYFL
ncbi:MULTISPECIES: cyd operon protein YbgE [Dickeya]|uniref:Cyd operon protein YbgE n=1 Tax=Dickeya oryzae TaxID=1240404 RepID=A0AB39IKK5_9GAMM|nr:MULTISPECIES: cyd operon protein YbgE [Dickeya]MBP2849046.1 cyd operon protein YbgE [Dickeya oryzae]MCA6994276.1 cyd operon protein YbgE [Dickeya oryzae]UPT56779.1 cyd operon protein YbgE [Dickeya zeae]